MNHLMLELEAYPDDTPWEVYQQRYKKDWNSLKSQLRVACPKQGWAEEKKNLSAVYEQRREEKEKAKESKQKQLRTQPRSTDTPPDHEANNSP